MATIFEELGIDLEASERNRNLIRKKELEGLKRTIKQGSGHKPESLKLYNKYLSKYEGEPITAREYLSELDMMKDDIDAVEYMILCTQDYCNSVFGINAEIKDAARIANPVFQKYYEEGNKRLNFVKEFYPKIIKAVKNAHVFTDAKLKNATEVLEALDIELPFELALTILIQKKYGKNQHKNAIKNLLKELIPQIDNQIILEQIASEALR